MRSKSKEYATYLDTRRRYAPPTASSHHSWLSSSTSRADLSAFGVNLRFFPPRDASKRCQKSSTNNAAGIAPATRRREVQWRILALLRRETIEGSVEDLRADKDFGVRGSNPHLLSRLCLKLTPPACMTIPPALATAEGTRDPSRSPSACS